jgi:hypothetical protein
LRLKRANKIPTIKKMLPILIMMIFSNETLKILRQCENEKLNTLIWAPLIYLLYIIGQTKIFTLVD